MKNKTIEQELNFLAQLKEMAEYSLLTTYMDHPEVFPKNFNVGKGIDVLRRVLNAELDYLQQNPEDYLEIYGE